MTYEKENPNNYESLHNRYFNLRKHISHYSKLLAEHNIDDNYSRKSEKKVLERIEFYVGKKNEKIQKEKGEKNSFTNNTSNGNSYCNLTREEVLKYLSTQRFMVNGKSMSFSSRYDYSKNKYIPNQITINGNNSRIIGDWELNGTNQIYLSNVKQVSGSFDPTTNYAMNGYVRLGCDGNLKGDIGKGTKRTELNIIKNK